ncbi:MAG: response regulator [Lachnospiraceae bacterium]|nr:response regulator [Lachnospiraceae bacterium]
MEKIYKSGTNENRLMTDTLTTVLKVIFFILISFSILGLIFVSSIDHSDPFRQEDPKYIDEWTVTFPDGSVKTTGRSLILDKPSHEIFTIVSTLPDNISDNSLFSFVNGKDIEIYIDGSLRADFFGDRDIIIPGGCVKRFYMTVPVNSEDSGKEIKLIRYGSTTRGQVYSEAFVTTERGLYSYLMEQFGLSLMLAEILMIFSGVIIVISLAMMILYKQRIDMLYGALAVFDIAAWTVTNSFLYPFIYGHYHIEGFFNYLFCLLMPFPLVFYVDILQKRRYHRIMNAIIIASTINFLIWPILHITNIFSLSDALVYINIFLGIMIVISMGILVVDVRKKKAAEYRYTLIGFVGLLVFGLVELVLLNFFFSSHDDVPMQIGLTFLLTMSVVQQIYDLRKIIVEKQQAIDMSNAKTNFLASMSHEIRTPINAILGMNEMILRDNSDPTIDDYARSVKSSGKMLLMLVNDVLDFSKIEAGKMEIANVQYRMSGLLRDIIPMLNERATEKHIRFNVVLDGIIPNGQISDEFRIRQILINLIGNAIKYTDMGTVELILSGQYSSEDTFMLKMDVKDTGKGIKEEDLSHLFEAFTRGDIKQNRNIEGTGLGLAIVKNIVDSMDGTISVSSTFGAGSVFSVVLPVDIFDSEPIPLNFEEGLEHPADKQPEVTYRAPYANILAVDDNRTNLRIVRLFLKRVEIVPALCTNGKEALEMCKREKFDLILLDHMMPEPDGIETLHLIKEDPDSKNKDTPVIVFTANAVSDSRELYMKEGFADYLTKPVDANILENTVKKYLPDDKILPV